MSILTATADDASPWTVSLPVTSVTQHSLGFYPPLFFLLVHVLDTVYVKA